MEWVKLKKMLKVMKKQIIKIKKTYHPHRLVVVI